MEGDFTFRFMVFVRDGLCVRLFIIPMGVEISTKTVGEFNMNGVLILIHYIAKG